MILNLARQALSRLTKRVQDAANIWARKSTGKVSIFLFLLTVVDFGELIAALSGFLWARHKAKGNSSAANVKASKAARKRVSEVLRKSTVNMHSKQKQVFKHLVGRLIGLMLSALKSGRNYSTTFSSWVGNTLGVLNVKGRKPIPTGKALVVSEKAKPGEGLLWLILGEAIIYTLFDLMDDDEEFEGSAPDEHSVESSDTIQEWLNIIWTDSNGNETPADANPFPTPRRNDERSGMGGNLANFRIKTVDIKSGINYSEEEKIANDVGVSLQQVRLIKARL